MSNDIVGDTKPIVEIEISMIDLISTLVRRKKIIIASTLCIAIASFIYCMGSLVLPARLNYLPNKYRPIATMLVNSPDSSGGLSSMLAASGLSGLAGVAGVSIGGSSYGNLAVFIARSNTNLDAIIEQFRLASLYKVKNSPKAETRKMLLKNYSVGYEEKTGVLSISYEGSDPILSRDIVNYAVELLEKRFMSIGGNRNVSRKEQLESKIADVKGEMTRVETEIQKFQKKYGIITVDSIASEQVSTVAQIRSELIMKEMEIKTYGDVSKVKDPALRRLQAERDNLSKLLEGLEQGYSDYERVLPSQSELSKLAIEFSHLQRDLLVQEKIFELLTQQYELTKLQLAGSDPIIQILEAAEAPDKKSGPSRAKICFVATMTAFFLSIIAVFILEAIKKIKEDPEALSKLKGDKI